MLSVLIKIILLLLIPLLFCIPFLPAKCRISLNAANYPLRDRKRHLAFVLAALLVAAVLVIIVPTLRNLMEGLLSLGFMQKLLQWIPNRTVYNINVITALLFNLLVFLPFYLVKAIVRGILDAAWPPEASGKPARKARKAAKKPAAETGGRGISALAQIIRDSVLSPLTAKDEPQKKAPSRHPEPVKAAETDPVQEPEEQRSLFETIWRAVVGVFYDPKQGFRYVYAGTSRWAAELRIFLQLTGLIYLAVVFVMLLPVFFSIGKDSILYVPLTWITKNFYMYPSIAFAVLHELCLFLEGETEPESEEAPDYRFFAAELQKKQADVDLGKLRGEYLKEYGSRFRIRNIRTEPGSGSPYTVDPQNTALKNIELAVTASQGAANGDYLQGVEFMLNGQNVLFDSSLFSSLGPYLLHYITVRLSLGLRIVFVCKDANTRENVKDYLTHGLADLMHTGTLLWRIETLATLHSGMVPDILLLLPEELIVKRLYADGGLFFNELSDVFVPDAEKIVAANNYYCLIMSRKLSQAVGGRGLRYTFLSNGNIRNLDNSIQQYFNLGSDQLRCVRSFAANSASEIFVWSSGGDETTLTDSGANAVNIDLDIVRIAKSSGVKRISLISDAAIHNGQLNEMSGVLLNRYDPSRSAIGFVIIADDRCNLPNTVYQYSRFSGRKESVLHIISKPYLFREYFLRNLESYISRYDLLSETMAEHADPGKASFIVLLCDAVRGLPLTEFRSRVTELCEKSGLDAPAAGSTDREFVDVCLRIALGDGARDIALTHTVYSEQAEEFGTVDCIRITDPEDLFRGLLESTGTVTLKFSNTLPPERIPVFASAISQHFLRGQIIVHNNRNYTIMAVDPANGTLLLDDSGTTIGVPDFYIQTRRHTVSEWEMQAEVSSVPRADQSVVSRLSLTRYRARVATDTVGYYRVSGGMQMVNLVRPGCATFVECDRPARETAFRDFRTNVLRLRIESHEAVEPGMTMLLAVILQELMKTLYPALCSCISVCPVIADEAGFIADCRSVRDLYPMLTDTVLPELPGAGKNAVELLLIEDQAGGCGVAETLTEGGGVAVENLLHTAADFLHWTLSENGKSSYLCFGCDEPPKLFAFAPLLHLLRQYRMDIRVASPVLSPEDRQCSFCLRQLAANGGVTLSDGRVLCSSCRNTLTDSYEKLDECFAAVLKTIRDSTSVPDTFPEMTVSFVSSKRLHELFGGSGKTVPMGCVNTVTREISVEYGLPRAAMCGCLAHLITELWQDLNLAFTGDEAFLGQPDYVQLAVLNALAFGEEAARLESSLASSAGLTALRAALETAGTADSFAFLLNGTGDGQKKRPEPTPPVPKESDIAIADRDAENLPRYHYLRLSESGKANYNALCTAMTELQEKVQLPYPVTSEELSVLFRKVQHDNPQIFWISGYSAPRSERIETVFPKYAMTPQQARKFTEKVQKATAEFVRGIKPSMSDYDVAVRAFENIISLIDYDSLTLEQEKAGIPQDTFDRLRSVYGVFAEKKAVCAGYAKAFQYLMQRVGIECAYVVGNIRGGNGHAWNLIKLEGDYYYTDVTFCDSTNTDPKKDSGRKDAVSYDYFGITTEELLRDRDPDPRLADNLPTCTATRCCYLVRSGAFFGDFDFRKIRAAAERQIKAGHSVLCFKFANAELLRYATEKLFAKGAFHSILDSLEDGRSISYSLNEKLYVLHIYLNDK